MRNINVSSTPAAAVKPAKPARTIAAKPGKPAAKPATPAKPDASAKLAARTERTAVLDANRAAVSRFYNGASLTVHKSKAATFEQYASRAVNPVQKCGPNGATERDTSDFPLILANSKNGTFDPVALGLDIGAFSRCASVNFISYDAKAKTFALTPAGIERAKLLTRKAS